MKLLPYDTTDEAVETILKGVIRGLLRFKQLHQQGTSLTEGMLKAIACSFTEEIILLSINQPHVIADFERAMGAN